MIIITGGAGFIGSNLVKGLNDAGYSEILVVDDLTDGTKFRNRVRSFGIEAVVTAPRSPWQNPYVERLIGSIRRECLDHVIVSNDQHLKRLLTSYFQHYHSWRVHRSLDMDCPHPRPVQSPELGRVVEVPDVGGLQHHYERRAA